VLLSIIIRKHFFFSTNQKTATVLYELFSYSGTPKYLI